jgi:hypothetical protein
MGPDGRTSGHCCIKSAETGPGSLHSWPVLALQGQLKGPADETSKMVAARGCFPGVVLAEEMMPGLATRSHQSAASGGGGGSRSGGAGGGVGGGAGEGAGRGAAGREGAAGTGKKGWACGLSGCACRGSRPGRAGLEGGG